MRPFAQRALQIKSASRKFDAANTKTLGSCTEAVCNPTVSASNNRISSIGYGFDATGNVTQDAEGRHFIYDAENHQTEVKDNLNNTIGEYLYDGEGKRVKKVSNTETTVFVYNWWRTACCGVFDGAGSDAAGELFDKRSFGEPSGDYE
ncbi:MAG: hypothetical protein WBD22_01755 [Pyrinomonadaceae bacterium]